MSLAADVEDAHSTSLRILKSNLVDARDTAPIVKVSHPVLTSKRKRLVHPTTLQVVCIKISEYIVGLL